MPTYDYVCRACGHRIEVMHGVHEQGPTVCPNCHARALRKAIVSPTVLYKGSGWAKKDRGSSARTKAAAKADSDGGSSGASASSDSSGSGSEKGSEKSSDKSSDSASDKASDKGSEKTPGPSSTSGSSSDDRARRSGGATAPSKGD
ncbi:MAG: zinc ribbon domain-containing protein [Chloroflexota bacterium]|nr:zinc ribbon domain-containing protein [Chloroflexota bacterium]